jgi:hypothetical protein
MVCRFKDPSLYTGSSVLTSAAGSFTTMFDSPGDWEKGSHLQLYTPLAFLVQQDSYILGEVGISKQIMRLE